MKINCDSQSAIVMVKNPYYNSKTNHIDLHYHLFKDKMERNKVLLEKIDMLKNITVLIMEPNYLPDLEVLFHPCLDCIY
jgi:hypothetical protein